MESIYGDRLPQLEAVKEYLEKEIARMRAEDKACTGMDPVEHVLARIKSEESMREKCMRKGLPQTQHSALVEIHDAIGVRIVTSFLRDIYMIRDQLAVLPGCRITEEKDYIRHAKPNGYRSYHLILEIRETRETAFDEPVYAEIQLRTISQDTWAALEHHLKYKKQVGGNVDLIVQELKRCADELASTDVSMQTIRDMILE